MRNFRTVLIILSSLLIAAHFLRSGTFLLVLLALGSPALLLLRERWASRTLQLLLLLAGAEWIRTLVSLAMERAKAGEPWIRMAMILGAVAAVTFAAALMIRAPKKIETRAGSSPNAE